MRIFKSSARGAAPPTPPEGYGTRLKECQSAAINAWRWMPAKKMREQPAGKMGCCVCEPVDEGGNNEVKRERYWESVVRRLGRRRPCDDGCREKWWIRQKVGEWGATKRRGRMGERAIVRFLTPPQKTPWQAVNHRSWLDWFAPLFNQHFTLRPSPAQNTPGCQLLFIYLFILPFFYIYNTSGQNCDCHIRCPRAASNQQIRWEHENMFLS